MLVTGGWGRLLDAAKVKEEGEREERGIIVGGLKFRRES